MKKRIFAAAAVFLLLGCTACGFGVYPLEGDTALFYEAKRLTLAEPPEQITEAALEAADVSFSEYQVNGLYYYNMEGAFVPFSIRSKKGAYRAAMSCAELLGLEDAGELRYAAALSGTLNQSIPFWFGRKFYIFYQYYGDIPVMGGSVMIETAHFGTPELLDATLLRGLSEDIPTEPKLTEQEAKRIAAKHEGQEPVSEEPVRLLIVPEAIQGAALAWVVTFSFDGWPEEIGVDAMTGEIIELEWEDDFP